MYKENVSKFIIYQLHEKHIWYGFKKFSILISNFNTKLQLVVDGWGLMTSVTRKRYLIQGLHIKNMSNTI